jgi:hypothetical protein
MTDFSEYEIQEFYESLIDAFTVWCSHDTDYWYDVKIGEC